MERIREVDAVRGIAILLMVVYHIFFDLDYFGLMDIDIFGLGWVLFQRLIAVLFIGVAGVSLTLSESHNKEGYWRHAKRGLKLSAVALLITLATWIYPHEGFILFGIIHFIALATFIAPIFFRFGHWNILLGALLVIAGLFTGTMLIESRYLFWLGFAFPGYQPLDHYPLIPWFGVVLLGMYAGQRLFPQGNSSMSIGSGSAEKLGFLGRHSLLIYLLHQPIIVGLMLVFKMILI